MSRFNYSEDEKVINRVLKYNQDKSETVLNDEAKHSTRKMADNNVDSSIELLKSLGYGLELTSTINSINTREHKKQIEHKPQIRDWDSIVQEACENTPADISIEDILTQDEINSAYKELDEIEKEFSNATGIVNKIDLCFLAIATGLQVAKSLIFPYIAYKFEYGHSFNKDERLKHNDKSIEDAHREANDRFRDKNMDKHKNGYWINILYQTPPYDITAGSAALGINMEGAYHRLHTLGHDPILGWLFGTANILTDIITLNDFRSYRVRRKPTMLITPQMVGIGTLMSESYQTINDDYLNLPAAIFAQAQHLKSDAYTKVGLPVPLLSIFNEKFASELYKSQYDALCLARDAKINGASYIVSRLIDTIIGLIHGLFRTSDISKKLYEVRTRKILLISNTLASTSTIINSTITGNPEKLDIGSLLSTVSHLFTDIRFILKVKQEFIENEIQKKLQDEFDKIDNLYDDLKN